MMAFLRRLFVPFMGVFLASVTLMLFLWLHFLRTPVIYNDEGVHYTVQEGASLHSVIHELYLLDVIQQPLFFRILVDAHYNVHTLKAGEYFFPKGTTPSRLLKQITSGTGMVYHEFTVVAGWTFHHLRDTLRRDTSLKHESASLSDQDIMTQLGHPGMNPEGMFFPDTYFFVRGTSDMAVLRQAFSKMEKILEKAWQGREHGLPFKTPLEALTAASLIEKETALAYERPLIAGVIINRLNKNMLLQIDPTVIYAAGSGFDGTIHRRDLKRVSPYNTYVTKGLPPTPIGIPGLESINAVMHPVHHEYFYFVAKNFNMDGPHRFSSTLEEHYQAIGRAKKRKSRMEFFNNALILHYFTRKVMPGLYSS